MTSEEKIMEYIKESLPEPTYISFKNNIRIMVIDEDDRKELSISVLNNIRPMLNRYRSFFQDAVHKLLGDDFSISIDELKIEPNQDYKKDDPRIQEVVSAMQRYPNMQLAGYKCCAKYRPDGGLVYTLYHNSVKLFSVVEPICDKYEILEFYQHIDSGFDWVTDYCLLINIINSGVNLYEDLSSSVIFYDRSSHDYYDDDDDDDYDDFYDDCDNDNDYYWN